MALTINTQPDIYSNLAVHTVNTSLTEGASYQNLRIRGELYVEGEKLATKVQRDGANDFDFSDILRSLCKPWRVTLGALQSLHTGGSPGSNLITAWSNSSPAYDTFTSSANIITSMIKGTGPAKCISNIFSVTAGVKYSFAWSALIVNSGTRPKVSLNETGVYGNKYVLEDDGDAEVFVFTAQFTDANAYLQIETDTGDAVNISTWTLLLYNMPVDIEDTTLCVHYFLRWSEMYENASDVTTIGDQDHGDSRMFFGLPARFNFDDFLCDDANALFLTPRDIAPVENIYGNPAIATEWGEIQLNFICKKQYIYLAVASNNGSFVCTGDPNYSGFGMVKISVNALFSSGKWKTQFYLNSDNSPPGTVWSVQYDFRQTTRSFDPAKHLQLEWENKYGGGESFIFLGGYAETEKAERLSYRNDDDRNRLVRARSFTEKKLIAPNCTPGEARAIAGLIQSKIVYLIKDEITRTEVFVVNNSLKTYDNGQLIDVEITIQQ